MVKRSGKQAHSLSLRPLRIAASLAGLGQMAGGWVGPVIAPSALVAAEVLFCKPVWAQARPAANALPVLDTAVKQYGTPISYTTAGNAATITQTAQTNIVSWKGFDIGSAAAVKIVQPSASAVLLNKIDSSVSQTVIDGMLGANGRVYLYNPNGIIFGKTATVNVNTLIASSLKFDESRVIGGLLQPGATPVLAADPAPAHAGVPGAVVVEGDSGGRAALTAENGGFILLAAPSVINNGILNAPDGQVMLAAGSKVYLAAPQTSVTGTSLRGLLVEVSNDNADGSTASAPETRIAENGTSGQINVGHGNATMIGYAVNQKGLVSASTSVNLNGSIYLYARDQAVRPDANAAWAPSRTGTLVLGPNSVTQVLPDLADSSTVATSAASSFNKSTVTLNGADIQLQQNASIIAPGGAVAIKAERLVNNPGAINPDGSVNILDPKTANVRVDFAPGSIVDVSGSTATQLAMESNVITVDLRGTELADNVVLRDSPLYATKVQVDIRKGSSIANIDGWLGLVPVGIGQLTAAGGTVKVSADGAIIQRAGSSIKVDGGRVSYLDGYVNTTQLQLNDSWVDIGSATSGTLYTAVRTLPTSQLVQEAGYIQGSNAGTVKFSAPIVVMQGQLSGQVTAGIHQRDITAADYPQGGQLQIGNVSDALVNPLTGKASTSLSSADQFGFAGTLVIGGGATETAAPPTVGASFDVASAEQSLLASRLTLDTTALSSAGFSRLTGLTSGNIEVSAPVNLAPGGHLWLGAGQGTRSNADGSLSQGGDLSFSAPITIPGGSVTAAASGKLQVLDGVSFNLAGTWVNDRTLAAPKVDALGNPLTPLVPNGGTLSLYANQLHIGNGVSADVSAGAWMNGSGKTTQGKAGAITFQADPFDPLVPTDAALQIGSNLGLAAFGFGSGGKLKLVGRNVTVGPTSPIPDPLDLFLTAGFFQQGGFTNYDIGANVNFTVAANTLVQPQARNWLLNVDAALASSGSMGSAASTKLLDLVGPAQTRPSTSLSFRALAQPQTVTAADGKQTSLDAGKMLVDSGARVVLDPGANLNLLAGQQLTVLGSLSAPAGRILLDLTPTTGTVNFNAARSIWFGPSAEVLATGSSQRIYTNGDGVSSGEMLDGGTIQIGHLLNGALSAADGFVVAQAGSVFDVSGAGAKALRFKYAGGVTTTEQVASSGGSIEVRASEGLLFAGSLAGAAGGVGSKAGSLTVALDRENQSGDSYPTNERVLTISAKAPTGGIVPAGFKPGDAIVTEEFGTGNNKDVSLGWFLTGHSAGSNPRNAGQGWLAASSFAGGGFGRLNFKSQDILAFGLGTSSLSLSAGDSLILDAPGLRADANAALTTGFSAPTNTLSLNAPYIQLGSADSRYQIAATAATGNATLTANATTIDLIGNSSLQGFGEANLNAKADVRLVGLPTVVDVSIDGSVTSVPTGYMQGSLAMVGNLALKDAQTYPTTLSDFTFSVASSNTDAATGKLTFATNGNTPQEAMSAGGSLTAMAAHIIQGGQVVAPFGAITLGNLDSGLGVVTSDLTYRPGSVTSVAGSGVVPFGSVFNGAVAGASDWEYALSDGTLVSFVLNPLSGGKVPQRALPVKAIVSHASTLTQDSGAVLNVAGGGSLYSYEFTPGKGGSKDVLANNTPGSSTTVFAINPNFSGKVAPIDSQYGSDGGLAAGDSVYLSGMPGLAAGMYTLLPAHYALLPGGFSISLAANTRDMPATSNVVQADGSMLMSGRLAESGSGVVSARANGFVVASGSVVRNKSGFAEYDATNYFTTAASLAGVTTPERPVDGGYLAFDTNGLGTAALALNGTSLLAAASGGRAGMLDISAPQIEVVANKGQSTGSAVKLIAADLNALGADSLLLGGLRTTRDGVLQLSIGANSVTIANDGGTALTAPEVLIAASGSVNLARGAAVASGGVQGRVAQEVDLAAGGALLRVSSGDLAAVVRSGTSTSGSLNIASGATVSASGSANLDATGGVVLNGALNLAAGSALGIGAPLISLGDVPTELKLGGLQFGTAGLTMLGGLSRLDINSYASTIGLYGTVNLGGSAMQALSFQGTGFQAYGSANRSVTFLADTVRFDGTLSNASPAPSAATSGALVVQANTIEIGNKAFAVHGFAETRLTANSQILAAGSSGQLVADQNMTLAAGRISTLAADVASFKAGGSMLLTQVANPVAAATPAALGGQLSFAASSILSDANILAPAGKVTLSAANGVEVSGGLISVAGKGVSFGGTSAYAPGGMIGLYGGAVAVDATATLDVSATGAAAGLLSVSANLADASGAARLDGTLKAGATAGIDGLVPTQGQFALDADSGAAQFGGLNTKLNDAGFLESRQFRYRNGDVVLAGNDKLIAHQVLVAVDNGNISIGGNALIDASGEKGGSIELYAAQAVASGNAGKVSLSDQAELRAVGTAVATSDAGSSGNGGRVVIGTSSADGLGVASSSGGESINLQGGSIDVAGSSAGRNGSVTLRAPRLSDASDVAIASLNSKIINSAATVIEAYKVYRGSSISEATDSASNLDASSGGRMYTDASQFAQHQTDILVRLGATIPLSLSPGIEVRAPADLSVSVNEFAANAADRGWNLNPWRFNGAPVLLTLRAAGNLNILGSISDGFVKPTNPAYAMPNWALDVGNSASYRLAGGADLGAANPLAVNYGGGDVYFGFAERTPTSAAALSASDAPVALVRTGTGRIDVAAGRDVTLGMAKFFVNHSSDPTIDGTPVIYDAAYADGSFKVSVYGAQVYTAGQAADLAAGFTAPQNTLNTHYGAAAGTLSDATFGINGGAITLSAGRDVTGPHNLGSDWFYRNADGQAAAAADPAAGTAATPAVAGTKVMLPATTSPLVNNWLFRQGRSYLDANGDPVFEMAGKQFLDSSGRAVTDISSAAAVNAIALGKVLQLIYSIDANGRPHASVYEFSPLNTAWWSRYDYFNQGVATFGGGDVSIIAAGGKVTDLSASTATSAYAPTPSGIKEMGGGDLLVRAGGDILGGAFYVQNGTGQLRADGSITAGNTVPSGSTTTAALNPLIALGDATFSVTAGRDLTLETAYNPMLTEQSVNNVVAGDGSFGAIYGVGGGGARWNVADVTQASVDYRKKYGQFSNFSTYGLNSGVKLTALGGDLLLSSQKNSLSVAGGADIPNKLGGDFPSLYLLEPGHFSAAALSGDLFSLNGFVLSPLSSGQLDLLAAGSVSLKNGAGGGIRMLDNDPGTQSNSTAPRVLTATDFAILGGTQTGIAAHMLVGLHTGDTLPLHIIALAGDIIGDSSQATTLSLPKLAEIQAGRDIRDLGFSIQHNNASDVSTVEAGRDFIDTTQANGNSLVTNVVTGPGRVDITAGRNVDLGNGNGLVTRGNLDNPYLPEGGAGINVAAGGAKVDYSSFVRFLSAYGSAYAVRNAPSMLSTSDQAALVAYLRGLNPKLPESLDVAGALNAFLGLSADQQSKFVANHLATADLLSLLVYVGKRAPAGWVATASASDIWSTFRTLSFPDQVAFLGSYQTMLTTSEQSELIAYVLGVNPKLSANLNTVGALNAFRTLSADQQSAFISSHVAAADMLALLVYVAGKESKDWVATASAADLWAAFRALPSADQQTFLGAHPAVALRLNVNAAMLLAELGAAPDYTAFSGQDLLAMRAATGLSPVASAEATWGAFRKLPQSVQSTFLDAHPVLSASLGSNAETASVTAADANKTQLNASFFTSLVETAKQTSTINREGLAASLASLPNQAQLMAELIDAKQSNPLKLLSLLDGLKTQMKSLPDYDKVVASLFALPNFDKDVSSLFPTVAVAPTGNIAVFGSQFKTEQGGAINLFAPTGSVYAGLTTDKSGKSPSNLGIFTIRGGALASLVKDDFLVNLGRVFTLGGGDITLISQYGNIDAGKGAKTASSAPPPLITITANGTVSVDVSGSISGSGIGTLTTHAGQLDANVYLIAPRGVVDAGDAGVRSSGFIDDVAPITLNEGNFSSATPSAGAAPAASGDFSSPAAPADSATKSDDVTKSLSSPTDENATLNVEVLGYGDEGTSDDDAGGSDDPRKKKKKKL